ncbi:hypothetical protein RHGRI_023721 [Rhododendron griersonianum]|uniref:Uncharacterized protein n=1 Tax=Rhododendron griersonianum TaxID=479676 RepID=A0AAV6J4U0_9ERIC|nr:hypothetical protein RHGRI_023721 [Rhododendron griersonianum]
MVRGGKKEAEKNAAAANPEAEERKRRKRVAFSKGILSEAPAKASTAALLSPSKTVTNHHGKDILRKSQRKNREMFETGGAVGQFRERGGEETKDSGRENIVFSEAWWIGRKEENPEEARLELPRELSEAHDEGYDFKGGAGAPSETKQGVKKAGLKYAEQESPKTDLEDDFSDSQNNFEDFTEAVCTNKFSYAVRFPLSPTGGEAEVALGATKPKPWPIDGAEVATVHSCLLIVDHDNEDAAASTHFSGKAQPSARSFDFVADKCPGYEARVLLQDERLSKKVKVIDDRKAGQSLSLTVEDDDIEEFSSKSKDSDGSDEDWAG